VDVGNLLSHDPHIVLQTVDGRLGVCSIHLGGVLSLVEEKIERVDLLLRCEQLLLHLALHTTIVLLCGG